MIKRYSWVQASGDIWIVTANYDAGSIIVTDSVGNIVMSWSHLSRAEVEFVINNFLVHINENTGGMFFVERKTDSTTKSD